MRSFSIEDRRRSIVHRHHLGGDGAGPDDVAAGLVALHATDPASVYLSVLARSARTTIADIATAMYDRRTLVRWMAMRRTLFVFPTADVPVVQAAVSAPLAAALRRQLLSRIRRNGADPVIAGDIDEWLSSLGDRVEQVLRELGTATGAQVSAGVPDLRTTIRSGAPSQPAQKVTSPFLTVMGTEGRIVRGAPTGAWTSRHHRWEPVETWWPDGLPDLDTAESERTLARRWLERFGPATIDDLRWWTGWNKTTVGRVLAALPVEDVDLHGEPGIALAANEGGSDTLADSDAATLLPSLDPTPMGWKHREWFFGIDPGQIFDRAGNIGPTVWWNGEVVGSWAVAGTGEVRTIILADRGAAAAAAVDVAAEALERRLDGAMVTPAIRTPLESSIA